MAASPLIAPHGQIEPSMPLASESMCVLGKLGDLYGCFCYGVGSGNGFFTQLRASDCAECGSTRLQTAHIAVGFWAPCNTVVATVRIVAATGDPAYPEPDVPLELCAPVSYTLSAPAQGLYHFALPMLEGCCVTGDAFLQVTFQGHSRQCPIDPAVTIDETRSISWYLWYGGEAVHPSEITCAAVECGCPWSPASCGLRGQPIMYVDAECCMPVGTESESWGRVKATYR
jgi:hypothetical protein